MQLPHRQNSEHNANMNQTQAQVLSKVQRSASAHNQKVMPHMYGTSTENSTGELVSLDLPVPVALINYFRGSCVDFGGCLQLITTFLLCLQVKHVC